MYGILLRISEKLPVVDELPEDDVPLPLFIKLYLLF